MSMIKETKASMEGWLKRCCGAHRGGVQRVQLMPYETGLLRSCARAAVQQFRGGLRGLELMRLVDFTLPKFNMEPKNDGFQKESPIARCHF